MDNNNLTPNQTSDTMQSGFSFCMNCGAKIPSSSPFCSLCGHSVHNNQQPYGQPNQQPYGQPNQQPYGQPNQQPYGQPNQQPYGQPNQQPYGQPNQQPYGQPNQQPYGQPNQQPYSQPNQQPYGQPSYAQPGQNSNYGYMPQYQQSMGWFKFLIYFALWAGGIINCISGINTITGAQYGEYKSYIYVYYSSLQVFDIIFGIFFVALGVFSIYTRFQLAAFKKAGIKMLYAIYGLNSISALLYIIAVMSIVDNLDISSLTSSITSIIVSAVMIFVNMIYFKKRMHMFK